MKFKSLYIALATVGLLSCSSHEEYGESYDINLPVSTIEAIEPLSAYVDDNVTIHGENLDLVKSVLIGGDQCEIVEKSADKLTFKVSRKATRGQVSIGNSYSREYISLEYFSPKYYAVAVTAWPNSLEREGTFTITGENVDLISKVKVADQEVERQGTPTREKAIYSLKGITLDAEVATIEIEDLTGATLTSDEIAVTQPSSTYTPAGSIWLADFDTVDPTFAEGWGGSTFLSQKNGSTIAEMFGSYWTISSDAGNGWDGCYTKMIFDGGGAGFDLSGFNDPHLTFLVNTNGKSGYFTTTFDGKELAHFTGQEGEYTDNYKFTTEGWEWRSYNLTAMGFENSGAVGSVEFWIRGGNVNDAQPFEINFDQVMITDGPMSQVVLWDMETEPNIYAGSWTVNGGTGVAAPAQGDSYYTLKAQVDKAWANVIGGMSAEGVDCSKITNSLYCNFLINTGTTAAGGYFQMIFVQDGYDYVKHFYGNDNYEDNYSFNTAGEWQWRSWRVDNITTWDWNSSGAPGLDLSKPFTFKAECKSGNIAADKGNSGEFELNLDYLFFSLAPMDK